jgi:AsmA protein
MEKGIKITGIVVLFFVLFVIAAAVVLPYLISLDTYKGMVEEQMEKALQRDCSLGTLRVTVLPAMGAKIEDLVISNPSGFSQTPLLSLESLQVRVKIVPLIFGKREIAGLALHQPTVFIEKDQRGRSNIPFVGEATTRGRKGTLKSGKVKTDQSKALQGLALSKASIRDGKFIYQDSTTLPSRRTEIERIDMDLRDLSLDKKIEYRLSLHWSPGVVSLDGSAGPLGKTIDIKSIPLEGRLRADFPQLDGLMKKLTGEDESTIQGALRADLEFKGDTGSTLTALGEIMLKDFSVGKRGERSIEGLDLALRPEAELSSGAERLVLTATLLLDKTPLLVKGQFTDLQRKPVGKVNLSSPQGIDLEELGPKLPALNRVVNVKGSMNLTGDFTVPNQGTPLLSLDADSPRMDIALVQQKKGQKKEAPAQKKTAGAKKSQKGSSLNARGKVRVKEGTFQGTDFHNLLLTAEMRGGEVNISQFSCAAFEGMVQGNGNINTAREPSPYRIKTKITGVDANAILSNLTSWKDMMKGTFNGDITLDGEGLSFDSLKQNLTGNGTVQVKDGELTWVNLIGRIVQAMGGKGWGKEKTTFEDLSSNFTVRNGRISFPNLLISHEDVDLNLQGDIGLDMQLKMEGEAHLPQSVTGDLSGKGWRFFSDDQGRLTIPFTLRGDIQDPKVGISTRLIEEGVKGVLEEFLQKKRKK